MYVLGSMHAREMWSHWQLWNSCVLTWTQLAGLQSQHCSCWAILLVLFFFFWDRVPHCVSGCFGTYSVFQTGLKIAILLPQRLECRDCKHDMSCPLCLKLFLNSDSLCACLVIRQPSEFFPKDKYEGIVDYKTTINASTEKFQTYLCPNELKFKVQNTLYRSSPPHGVPFQSCCNEHNISWTNISV